jgi:WD40 repeat protein
MVFSVAWSPGGDRIASGTSRGIVQIWDVASGEKLIEFKPRNVSEAISIGWSPDGNLIAEGLLNGSILLWDANSGVLRKTISGYTSRRTDVNGLDWSPDGMLLATAHQDGPIRVWDVESGELHLQLPGHRGWARGVAWSPNGELLATTGSDGRVVLWDVQTGQQIAEFRQGGRPVWSVTWSPDGDYLAAGNGVYDNKNTNGEIFILQVPSKPSGRVIADWKYTAPRNVPDQIKPGTSVVIAGSRGETTSAW